MLSSDVPTPLTPSAEQGLTLIELLVAMTLSIIVIGALLAILDISLRQETRISDQVQSNRTGRMVLSRVIDELHSSCTGFGTTAIQAPSTTPIAPLTSSNSVNLWFLSAYGNASSGNAVLTGVTQHDINWSLTETNKSGQTLGTLTDYSFASTGGSAPNWTFPALNVSNAKATVLAKNVLPPTSGSIFQYHTYNTSGGLVMLTAKELPLTTTTAANVAKVTVGFIQAPEKGDTRSGRTASLSDSMLLRFGPSETGSEAENAPCA
jgi:Tfp pilus assembly protein PilW